MTLSLIRAAALASLLPAALAPSAALAEDGPSVTVRPEGQAPGTGQAAGGSVPCNVLIRYDDGSDDFAGIGRTLGGASNETQGILATPPGTASTWIVQSAGFYADFWVTPGVVNIVVADRAVPAITTSESVFVDSGGVYEVAFSSPVCVLGDFDVLLCPEPGAHGVTGEDVAGPDLRSFHQLQVCANLTPVHNLDIMIWACVTPCDPISVERESWGSVKSRYD